MSEKTTKTNFVYVTRDIERALGMEPNGNYFIITNDTEYGQETFKKYPNNIWLVKGEKQLDTFELLSDEKVKDSMMKYEMKLIVFQNTSRIEEVVKGTKWTLLNPSAELSKKVEEKISQYEWLGDLQKYLPPTEIKIMSEIQFSGEPIVVQFNHAHTGQGTHIIKDAGELSELARLFPNRPARVARFIDGPVFTLNAVVTEKEILCGNISYQITGLTQFTDNPFSTIGNDWALPHKILSEEEREQIYEIARAVGARMKKDGWRGLFGIDVIYDTKNKKIFLLEINARQPASTTCESILQKMSGDGMSIFEAHVSSLLNQQLTTNNVQPITEGAQILLRKKNNQTIDIQKIRGALESKGFSLVPYENGIANKELLRIRSEKGIMQSHEKLNDLGETIASLIS